MSIQTWNRWVEKPLAYVGLGAVDKVNITEYRGDFLLQMQMLPAALGHYIAFDGIDGAGKTTQINLLSSALFKRNYPHFVGHEFSSYVVGPAVRNIITNHYDDVDKVTQWLLTCAARRDLLLNYVEPTIESGGWALVDRSVLTTLVYQGPSWAQIAPFVDGVLPSLIFLFDIEPETAWERLTNRGEIEEIEKRFDDLKFRRERYLKVIHNYPGWVYKLDANAPPEVLHQEIISVLETLGFFRDRVVDEL